MKNIYDQGVMLPAAALAQSFGLPLVISLHMPEDHAYLIDDRIVIGTKVAFVLAHPELKGWDLAEAWIAHKIHGSYMRALALHEERCDRLAIEHRERPLSTAEALAFRRKWLRTVRRGTFVVFTDEMREHLDTTPMRPSY